MVERAKLRREKLDFHFANNKENNQENILPDPCCIGNENAKDVPENDAMTGLQAHSNIRKLKLQNLALRYSDKTKPIESNELEQEKNTTKISPKKQKCKFGR